MQLVIFNAEEKKDGQKEEIFVDTLRKQEEALKMVEKEQLMQ